MPTNPLRTNTPNIRVATFAGPGAKPVIETVPWPTVPKQAALIQIGACGVCGTDQHILRGHWPKPFPGRLRSDTRSEASSSKRDRS